MNTTPSEKLFLSTVMAACVMLLSTTSSTRAEELRETLERMDRRVAEVVDLSADFEEQKFTSIMKTPLISKGRVRVRGDRSRWDTQEPSPMVMTVDAREVRLYYPDRKAMEVFPVDARWQPLMVSPLPRLDRLRKHFEIQAASGDEASRDAGRLKLELTPRDASMREFVDRLRVTLDTASAFVQEVELMHADGDRTVLRFSAVRTNTGLSESDVTLTVTPDTTVSRPLEGVTGDRP